MYSLENESVLKSGFLAIFALWIQVLDLALGADDQVVPAGDGVACQHDVGGDFEAAHRGGAHVLTVLHLDKYTLLNY